MKKLNRKTIMIVGGVLLLVVLIWKRKKILAMLGKRQKGYWKYHDSPRVYYSSGSGVVYFLSEDDYFSHRETQGLPLDYTEIVQLDVNYEEPNEYLLVGDVAREF
jgi:hypothetical protein